MLVSYKDRGSVFTPFPLVRKYPDREGISTNADRVIDDNEPTIIEYEYNLQCPISMNCMEIMDELRLYSLQYSANHKGNVNSGNRCKNAVICHDYKNCHQIDARIQVKVMATSLQTTIQT